MRENHKEPHPIDQLLEYSPKFRLSESKSSSNLTDIMKKLDKIEAQESRIKWIKWMGIPFAAAVVLMISFYWVYQFPFSNQFPLADTSEKNVQSSPTSEMWELSPVFQIEHKEDVEGTSLHAVGEKDKYGLKVEEFGIVKDQRVPLRTYYAEKGYKGEWFILDQADEISGKHMKVLARNISDPDRHIFLIPETELTYQEDYQVGVAETYYSFPSEGKWKLTLLVEEEAIGDIVISVGPASRPTPEEEYRLESIVGEIIPTFGISLDDYSFKDISKLLNREEYESLIYDCLVDILFGESAEVGDTIPFVYLNESETRGYIFVKKYDETHVVYYLENNAGQWSIIDKKSNKAE